MNIPKIKTCENKETKSRTSGSFRQLAKRKGVLELVTQIKNHLNVDNHKLIKLIISREQPDFFSEHYISDEDFAIYTQFTNLLGSSEAIYILEKGIRNLHLELFGERDLEQEFKDKGWMK